MLTWYFLVGTDSCIVFRGSFLPQRNVVGLYLEGKSSTDSTVLVHCHGLACIHWRFILFILPLIKVNSIGSGDRAFPQSTFKCVCK